MKEKWFAFTDRFPRLHRVICGLLLPVVLIICALSILIELLWSVWIVARLIISDVWKELKQYFRFVFTGER